MRSSPSLLALLLAAGCATPGLRPFPNQDPLWTDPDREPFAKKPAEYYSSLAWDGADQLVFRPITRLFAVDPGGEAVNVNALDEVPDSSWFENRMSRRPMTPDEVARGACARPPLDPEGPFVVVGGKPNGANPGFIVEAPDGGRYLFKFDGGTQPERASSADVIGSLVYHAAGYHTPCNRILFFRPEVLRLGRGVTVEDADGEEVPLERKHIDAALQQATPVGDGRVRASTSLFLEGEPLGPWTYQGTRADDPNDVVPHEDRRELRGAYVFAAWINHFDSREQNTLAMWIEEPGGGGWVKHHIIDFGDSLGSHWRIEALARRIGHSYYLDFGHILEDFFTFGLLRRPWDRMSFGPSGIRLAYFQAEPFDPDDYHPGYPNPAMARRTEADAAWAARILAEFTDAHVDALIGQARIQDPVMRADLRRVLLARRKKILRRFLSRLSPLARPELDGARLCLRDLAVYSGVARKGQRAYRAVAYEGAGLRRLGPVPVEAQADERVCLRLPEVGPGAYLVVDVTTAPGAAPARLHFYGLGTAGFRLVGLERPAP